MFRTKHSIGFGDYDSGRFRPGDAVFALDGLRTPLILRRLGDNKYKIVTYCYVMGALEYDEWKSAGGKGPWGELPEPMERTRMIDIY